MRIVRRPTARIDVVEIAVYLGTEADQAIADRFLEAVEHAYARLAKMPRIGSHWHSENPALVDVRKWPVPGFPNHLIFYRPISQGVEIFRVLYATRDLAPLLEEEG